MVSISSTPHLLANSRRSAAPAHEHRFLETWGDIPLTRMGCRSQLCSITAGGCIASELAAVPCCWQEEALAALPKTFLVGER